MTEHDQTHPFSFDALVAADGRSYNQVISALHISGTKGIRHQSEGLTADQADEYAIRLGLLPSEVWPNWYEGDPPVRWHIEFRCPYCSSAVEPVDVGSPDDDGRHVAAVVTCPLGHRSTLTVTLSAA